MHDLIRKATAPGPITGHGTGFKRAVRLHSARLAGRACVGKWRAGTNNKQYKGDGTYIDPDWYIVEEHITCLNTLRSQ